MKITKRDLKKLNEALKAWVKLTEGQEEYDMTVDGWEDVKFYPIKIKNIREKFSEEYCEKIDIYSEIYDTLTRLYKHHNFFDIKNNELKIKSIYRVTEPIDDISIIQINFQNNYKLYMVLSNNFVYWPDKNFEKLKEELYKEFNKKNY